jgi:membrane protein YqaA with SNARE-associated domain
MRSLFRWFFHLQALGLVLMGVLDSSFLFVPVGNDLLFIALTARHHESVILYVLAASVGSMLGVLLVDVVCRAGGEAALKRFMSARRLAYLQRKIKSRAALVLAAAAAAPPPFPFTSVVAVASALEYPRLRLLGVILLSRLVRFSVEGLVAVKFGRSIIGIMQSPHFRWTMAGFAVVCVVGSVYSIAKIGWPWTTSTGTRQPVAADVPH